MASRGGHGKVEGSAEWRVGKTVVTAFVKGPEITPPTTMMPSSSSLGLDATVQVKAIVKPVVGQAGERESGSVAAINLGGPAVEGRRWAMTRGNLRQSRWLTATFMQL